MTERGLDGNLDDRLRQWRLRVDGAATYGSRSLVVPVRTEYGTAAILKISHPDADSEHEHLVLRRWGGDGAVRLLSADPPHRAVLVERLLTGDLGQLTDVAACEIVAGLYRRLHVPALPQLRTLASCVETWVRAFEALPRNAPIPHRLVEQAITLGRDLVTGRATANCVLHGNLHYANVLAAEREPWLAISPEPLTGDPHYELAPMLLHRWDELAGDVRDRVRYRFHTLVDIAGFDEERSRAWVVVRAVHLATRELSEPAGGDTMMLTRYVAVAKAVQ